MFKRKPKELSASQLSGMAYGKKLEPFESRMRFIPKAMVDSAKQHLEETGDVGEVMSYILYGFYLFRDTVCKSMLVPQYLQDDAYEWPKPAGFGWSDISQVIIMGEYVEGPLIAEESKAIISCEEDGQMKEKMIYFEPVTDAEGVVRDHVQTAEDRVRELIPFKDNPEEYLKYRIDDLNKVGYLLHQQAWQSVCLRNFGNPLRMDYEAFVEQRIPVEKARKELEWHLVNLDKAYEQTIQRPMLTRWQKMRL
ncbi:MAG: hypothetical protein KJ709_00245 [Nanoarchaeota archaeon]|nr:hypothetical protein [Nanoarchaeota archaeon]